MHYRHRITPLSFQITVDCAEPHVLADWWAEALHWDVEPTDSDFIRRMIAESRATDDDTAVHRGGLVWKTGAAIRSPATDGHDGRRVLFQMVPEPKTVKNRVHLDVHIGQDHVEAEHDRLVALGATVSHRGSEGTVSWITLRDPEGNEFCIH